MDIKLVLRGVGVGWARLPDTNTLPEVIAHGQRLFVRSPPRDEEHGVATYKEADVVHLELGSVAPSREALAKLGTP